MAAGEGERFELLNSLIEALGEEVAHKLMDSLPPFSWDKVATKDDLNALATSITAKFDQVDAQFELVTAELLSRSRGTRQCASASQTARGGCRFRECDRGPLTPEGPNRVTSDVRECQRLSS